MRKLAEASAQKTAPPTAALAAPNGSGWLRKSSWFRRSRCGLQILSWARATIPGAKSGLRRAAGCPAPCSRLPFENLTGGPAQNISATALRKEMIAHWEPVDPASRRDQENFGDQLQDESWDWRRGELMLLPVGRKRAPGTEVKVRVAADIQCRIAATYLVATGCNRELRTSLALQSEIARKSRGIHLDTERMPTRQRIGTRFHYSRVPASLRSVSARLLLLEQADHGHPARDGLLPASGAERSPLRRAPMPLWLTRKHWSPVTPELSQTA